MIIKSLEHLKQIAKKIADNLSARDCLFLVGEIGVGKTTFTRILINYLQKREGVQPTEVLSPTFNLLYEYEIKNLKLMHYDLYRIKNISELEQLGIFDEKIDSIKIIEWAEIIKSDILDRLDLNFSYATKQNERNLILKGNGKWKEFKIDEL